MNLLRKIATYLLVYVVAPVVEFFDKGLDSLLADFNKLDAKLDRFVDKQNAKQQRLLDERAALRQRINTIWTEFDVSAEAAERASRIRDKVRDLVA